MTNYNERLDNVLAEFVDGCDCRIDEGQAYLHQSEFAADKAKQAITSLIKELVEEAKPKDYPVCENNPNQSDSSWCNKCWTCRARDNDDLWVGIEVGIEKYEQNLLKELEVNNENK